MDFEKFKQWMEFAQNYQTGEFWNSVLDPSKAEIMSREPVDPTQKFPPVDMFIDESRVILVIELPGFTQEEVRLLVSGNTLTIEGTSSPAFDMKPAITERYQGEFKRTLQLPEPVEGKNISARFHNGLLFLSYFRTRIKQERIFIE
ncbi:Hsp20/alpha crystallin family protein [Pseudobacillus sp. 179-B 2D1 NHS]|uniref:Hsp20/alpha crystallin family protein n=1 Tax=Pseudobacillus sp. 179-B 2D1 NHS TaxID=3374292 RepID=UPI003879F52C